MQDKAARTAVTVLLSQLQGGTSTSSAGEAPSSSQGADASGRGNAFVAADALRGVLSDKPNALTTGEQRHHKQCATMMYSDLAKDFFFTPRRVC